VPRCDSRPFVFNILLTSTVLGHFGNHRERVYPWESPRLHGDYQRASVWIECRQDYTIEGIRFSLSEEWPHH
jgi:hypothetical protein